MGVRERERVCVCLRECLKEIERVCLKKREGERGRLERARRREPLRIQSKLRYASLLASRPATAYIALPSASGVYVTSGSITSE